MNKILGKKASRTLAIVGTVVWFGLWLWVDLVVNFWGLNGPSQYVPIFLGGVGISFVIVMFKWMRSRSGQKGSRRNA